MYIYQHVRALLRCEFDIAIKLLKMSFSNAEKKSSWSSSDAIELYETNQEWKKVQSIAISAP